MSQITTPVQLKAAYPYQFDQPMDTWVFALAPGAIMAAVPRTS